MNADERAAGPWRRGRLGAMKRMHQASVNALCGENGGN